MSIDLADRVGVDNDYISQLTTMPKIWQIDDDEESTTAVYSTCYYPDDAT
jgi:hypothetical protein